MIENPLTLKLKPYHIILASGSPRRQQYMKELGIPFEIVKNPVEEVYPDSLKGGEIATYLAKLKSSGLKNTLKEKDILLTADTVVWFNNRSLAKPADNEEAKQILRDLSGQWHEVITSVCFTTVADQRLVTSTTKVCFKNLSAEEIDYYVEVYKPLDKAGAYGIQEWLGSVAITEIRGSYANVVGLPTNLVYKMLMTMVS
ncbi:Maf family nucleotide pyrophosphatase [uncultured Muriicola sp.]|uniref:Maf family nucleotide pyrophosphatase n=1 Tax=uncultured Muriicola sp. TaxID=1583102 RepID=UPI0026141A54|nr:Maf family nucleotide pyrophosphatase [uncultured Muriicola sp.]